MTNMTRFVAYVSP